MRWRLASVLMATLVMVASGCGGGGAPAVSGPSESSAAAATDGRTWRVRATVRQVDGVRGLLLATHEPIPDVMPTPMTMGFEAASAGVLTGVQTGQRVVLTLQQQGLRLVILGVSPDA